MLFVEHRQGGSVCRRRLAHGNWGDNWLSGQRLHRTDCIHVGQAKAIPEPKLNRSIVLGQDRDSMHLAPAGCPLFSSRTVECTIDSRRLALGGAVSPFRHVGALAAGASKAGYQDRAEKTYEHAVFQPSKSGAGADQPRQLLRHLAGLLQNRGQGGCQGTLAAQAGDKECRRGGQMGCG